MPEDKASFTIALNEGTAAADLEKFAAAALAAAEAAEKLGPKVDAAGEAMEDAGEQAQETGERVDQMARMMKADQLRQIAEGMRQIAGAAREVAGNVDSTVASVAEAQKAVRQWAGAVGLTADQMENLGRVGKLVGGQFSDVAEVGDLVQELGDRAKEAYLGTESYVQIFKALGIAVTDGSGQLRDAGELFIEVSDALGRMETSSLAMALAGDLMTDLGRQWIGTIRDQGGSLTALMGSMDRYGQLTESQRQDIEQYRQAQAQLTMANERLAQAFAAEAGPAVAGFKATLAGMLASVVEGNPLLATFIQLGRDAAPAMGDFAEGVFQVGVGLSAMGVKITGVTGLGKRMLGTLAGIGPVGWAVAGALAAVGLAAGAVAREAGKANEAIDRQVGLLQRATDQGWLAANAMLAYQKAMEGNRPSALQLAGGGLNDVFQGGGLGGVIGKASPFGWLLSGWAKRQAEELDRQDRARSDATEEAIRQIRDRPIKPGQVNTGALVGGGGTRHQTSEEEAKRKQLDEQIAKAERDLAAAERAAQRRRADAASLPASYRNGQRVGGYPILGVGSEADIHYGTHTERGTFDISGRHLPRGDEARMAEARRLASMGLIVAYRKADVDKLIETDHFHVVDPRLSPHQAASLRRQAQSNRRVVLPPTGTTWATTQESPQVAELRARLESLMEKRARLTGPAEVYQYLSGREERNAQREQARLDARAELLRGVEDLTRAGDRTALDQLAGVKGGPSTLAELTAQRRAAELAAAQYSGDPSRIAQVMTQQATEQEQERLKLHQDRVQLAEIEAQMAQAQLRTAQAQRRPLADQLAILTQLEEKQRALIDLKAQEATITADTADDARARLEAEAALAELTSEMAEARDRMEREAAGARVEAAEKIVRRAEVEMQLAAVQAPGRQPAQYGVAGVHLTTAAGELPAGAVPDYETAERTMLDSLRALESALLETGDTTQALEVRLRRLRAEQEANSRGTMAEQLLAAGPGVGGIQAYLASLGSRAVAVDPGGQTAEELQRGLYTPPALVAAREASRVDTEGVVSGVVAGRQTEIVRAGVAAVEAVADIAVDRVLDVMGGISRLGTAG